MDTNSKKSIDSSDADEEDLEIDDEEVEEFFESEERHMWREAYEQATSQYSDDFLTALTDPELLLRIMNTWEDLGLVGIKNKVTLALYCCLTKDFSQRVHNVWYGESRGGKTTPIEKMLKCFDPDVVEAYTRVTTTFIDHCEELTDGKIFYLNQFTQRDQNNKASEYLMGDEILDLLLSEGDRVLGTVVRNKPMRLRLHGKPLFISTTNYRPRITTSSRLQLTHANESLEQTEQIMWKKTEFYETGERPSDFSPFLMQFTHWFRENCKKQVKIPWARVLTLKLINLVRRNKALRWRDDQGRCLDPPRTAPKDRNGRDNCLPPTMDECTQTSRRRSRCDHGRALSSGATNLQNNTGKFFGRRWMVFYKTDCTISSLRTKYNYSLNGRNSK